jgi:hypothetical protein
MLQLTASSMARGATSGRLQLDPNTLTLMPGSQSITLIWHFI